MSSKSKTRSQLIQEVQALKKKKWPWQKIADFYGVSRALIWRIVNQNYMPKDKDIRKKLGLKRERHLVPVDCDTEEQKDRILSYIPPDERPQILDKEARLRKALAGARLEE